MLYLITGAVLDFHVPGTSSALFDSSHTGNSASAAAVVAKMAAIMIIYGSVVMVAMAFVMLYTLRRI